jgi:outer membrane protein OmpA-like peptidoglycan-associated protein
MSAFRIDARLAATAIVALGLTWTAPQRAAAQGVQDNCRLWSQMQAAVKAVDLKAAAAAEQAIDEEPSCSNRAEDAKKAVVDIYRALDARLERDNVAPKDRLAKLEDALKYGGAWDIHAKIADLQAKLPGKRDSAKIGMAYDRALVALDEMPESARPALAEIGRLTRLAYQYEVLAVAGGTPLQREGHFRSIVTRQINVGFVPAPLQFEFGKAELTLAGKAQAQALLTQLQARQMPALHLIGHTDPVGTFEDNDELSLRRAAAIKKFLEDNGYPRGRLTIAGRGKRDVASLKIEAPESFTEDQIHQMLRRVELKFKD